jgi:hypothetical protein
VFFKLFEGVKKLGGPTLIQDNKLISKEEFHILVENKVALGT